MERIADPAIGLRQSQEQILAIEQHERVVKEDEGRGKVAKGEADGRSPSHALELQTAC